MNAKPTFLPNISKWKVQCFKGLAQFIFLRRAEWEDCQQVIEKGTDVPSLIPGEFDTKYSNEYNLVTFNSYTEATEWMVKVGLVLCDDQGVPIKNEVHTHRLEKTYTANEPQLESPHA